MKTPEDVAGLHLVARCSDISFRTRGRWMEGATRANRRVVNRLVRQHLPNLYRDLRLDLWNPYAYYKTSTHLILVHSATEYFLAYRLRGGLSKKGGRHALST